MAAGMGASGYTRSEGDLAVSRKCLLIAYVWPEPQSSAAGLRDRNLIEGLLQSGYEVVIASASENEPGRIFCERWAGEVPALSVHPIRLNDSSFDSWVAELQPELVIFDRFVIEEQFGWRVRRSAPSAVCILDTQDLHFLRLSREQALRRALQEQRWTCVAAAGGGEWDAGLVCRELAAIHRVDLAWLVSDFERDLLVREFRVEASRLAVSRFAYPEPPWRPSGSAGERGAEFLTRSGFSMVGNFRHAPNLDAFRWLRHEIWPRVRRLLPRAEVHVYGAYPPKEAMEAHAPQAGFLVHGPAKDLAEVFSARRVSLAPLRFGAGIKGKIADSWWHGVPVVSTSIGREGMSDEGAWGGRVADEAAAFAQACVEIHESEGAWSAARAEGGRLLERLFSQATFMRDFSSSLENAMGSRRRFSTDWTRRILLQATTDSYRYFGKWLELKSSRGPIGGQP